MLGTRVSCAKMAEPIEMPFGRRGGVDSRGSKEPCTRWGPDPQRKGALLTESAHSNVPTHKCIAPAAGECACPAPRSGQMHSPSRGLTRRRCGLLPNFFGHLFSLTQYSTPVANYATSIKERSALKSSEKIINCKK